MRRPRPSLTEFALALVVAFSGCQRCSAPKALDPPKTVPDVEKLADGYMIDDASHMNATKVADVVRATTEGELRAVFLRATQQKRQLSFAGARHSQGKHTFGEGHIVVDVRAFNRILKIDVENKTCRVQSGVTWDQLQAALNEVGLALKTQQSSNIFTVGGSLSSNIHGRDPNASLMVHQVESMRVMNPRGEIEELTRDDELFTWVIGGYGVFGFIVDVDLALTTNALLEKRAQLMDYRAFPKFFDEVLQKPETALFIARPSIAPSSLLEETVVTWWTTTARPLSSEQAGLQHEKHVKRDKAVFDLSRQSDSGKEARWALQKKLVASPGKVSEVSRINAMRPPTAPLKLLEHLNEHDADIVQEYFIPKRHFAAFVSGARKIIKKHEVNLLGVTVRFVEADVVTKLPYAKEEAFSFMLYSNQDRDAAGRTRARAMTRALVDLTLELQGRHYLSYQTWPTRAQQRRAYPELDAWCAEKIRRDPSNLFSSGFHKWTCR